MAPLCEWSKFSKWNSGFATKEKMWWQGWDIVIISKHQDFYQLIINQSKVRIMTNFQFQGSTKYQKLECSWGNCEEDFSGLSVHELHAIVSN